ncbi:hypothetical protein DNTS_002633 [Danionella cerebrum]|uniref:T-box domain-containing protein n=1 Tax=Danionella cerebrum TaxID=2873325 RepID=A0A553QYY9_9TELE|nr:hypothetical protein DNTS_002633 [Danionella translucida]
MAEREKQRAMVLFEDGMATPTLAPRSTTTPPSIQAVLKQLQPDDSGADNSSPIAISESNKMGKSSPLLADIKLEHFPADVRCKGVTVTLDNNNMWNEFYRCQTEMILTKLGRRMFPCCRFRLSGMEPFQNYILAMDILPVDNYRYKWSGKGWEPNGKPEPHVSRLFVHPESPATGLHWMQNPVSFYKLKLCNSLDHEEHIILQSMHRYLPRLHIIPADKAIKPSLLDAPNIITLSFPQTEFFAVTAYQNLCITQLKIDYNPFAKGFREDAVNARSSIAKNGISIEELESEVKPSKEMTTLGNLKTLFMKRNASVKVNKDLKLPSPTNAEKTIVNGDALAMDTDIKAFKKRPSQVALSDFIKGARVKVKRASLEDVMKTKKDLQTSTFCEKNEVMDVSANVEKGKQFIIKEEKVVDECTTTDLITRTALLKSEEIMVESYEKNTERETSPSRDKNTPHSDGKGAEAFLSNEVKSKSNAKKVPSHKRPERVPLPLLAQFLKQRKFMTRPTTPKTGPQESSVDCEKSSETIQTPQSSSISLSSSICLSPNLDSQPAVPSGSQSVTSTTDLKFTTLSSPSSSSVSADAELSVGFSTSQVSIDPFNDPNTSSKPESDQTPDGIFSVDFMTDFENALGSQSDISSVFACDPVDDSCTTITSKAHNTDIVTQPVNPSTLSVFDASDIISYPKLASISNLAKCESISDKLFESSKGSCQEILSEVHPNPEFDESISVPLEDTPTPSFSLPSIASSPDPFPTAIFNDRSAPPRKSLDPCVDRLLHFKGSLDEVHPNPVFVESVSMLLDGTPSPSFSFPSSASSSPDPFPAALFNDRSAPPRKSLDPCIERLLHFKGSVDRELFPEALFQKRPVSPQNTIYPDPKSVAPTDSLPSGILNDPANPMEPSDPENLSSETKDSILYVDAADDCENIVSENCLATKPCNETKLKKSKAKQKKNFKMFFEENEASKGSLPVPMQPSLEDVDGQLFVSFMTKKALKIHLGDVRKDEKIEVKQPAAAELIEQSNLSIKRSIEALQEALEVDLEIMKNRQVIHPVLQEVGLKLNLLDVTLAIDLQYLGVRLPIPPYKKSHKRTSCEAGFVSRTGKTTDVTQIKGWKDKFTGSEPLSEGVSSTDPGQRNLSAFCSDMLDEYLASEGKLIDERAATLCPTDTTPVAYQLPTKSTSYVRTLDSVLKKNVPTLSSTIPSTFKGKTKFMPKVKEKLKKPLKPVKVKQTKPVLTNDKPALRMRTAITNKKMNNSDHEMSSPKKPPVENSPVQVFNKTPKVRSQDSHLKVTPSVSTEERSPSLPKTLMKLMDVEDGAVWEGKHRTFITEERAAIALATLSTSEGVSKGNPDAFRIIRRRAPPCLNLFCRLGCVCGSLVHSRRHHHCGKPQCMMGCSCLRRKVIALKNPKEEDITMDGPETCGVSENDTWKKKIFTQPEAAPEPVKHVKTLWNQNRRGFDPEGVFGPPPSKRLHSASSFREPPLDDERALNPLKPKKEVEEKTESLIKGEETNQTCARSRPFHFNRLDGQKTGYKHISGTSSEIEEGELLPQNLPGPAKRLEIISECSWPNPDSRDEVMRIVCEHMAQDHLKDPFWIGNYLIKPISQSSQEEDTYRVVISQRILQPEAENQQVPQSNLMKTDEVKKHKLKKDREKKDEENNDKGNIQQVKKDKEKKDEVKKHMVKKDWVEENKVRGLPFLSKCCPAGFLKAEKKAPDAPGSIIVNGKPYPQAKLELGQMGALHPANRLAAYITGRICPNPSIAKLTVPSTTVTTLTTVACSPAPVSMSLVGSNVPKMVIPSMLMLSKEAGVPGMVLSTHEPDLVTQVSEPSCSTGCTRLSDVAKGKGPFITIHSPSLPLSGAIKSSATAVSSAVLLTTVSSPAVTTALPSHGLRTSVTAPINSTTVSSPAVMTAVSSPPLTTVTSSALKDTLTAPTTKTIVSSAPQNKTVLIKINNTEGAQISKPTVQTPVSQASRQKMILKVMRTADGNTLYRSPDGQLMQLVPLSQFKGINPNLLSQSQVKLIRLPKSPTINLTESQGGSSTTTSIPVTLSQTKSPVIVAIPKPLPSSTKPAPALVSSIPSTLKVVEGLAGQSGTCTLRVLSPASSTLPLTLMKSDSLKPVSVNFAEEQIGPATKHPNIDAAKQEDLSVGITENAFDAPLFSVIPSNPSLLPGAETEPNIDAKHSADSEVVEILSDSTDVTDDSEFYSDEDAVHSNVSDKEVLEPEEIVDIETIKEAEDKDSYLKLRLNALRLKQRTKRNYYENDLDIKVKANEQIKSLVKQQDSLVKERQALLDKRQHYIERLSHLTDKSSHSINLNQITTNENTIETQPGQKTKRSKFNKKKKQNKPKYILKHKLVDRHDKPVEKDGAKPIFSPSKPIDLSTKKHRLQLPEIDATQPASKLVDANSRKNAVKAQDSTLGGTSEPSNIMTSILETKPQIVTSPVNHLRKGRERTRPNILSRCGSQPKDASPVKEPLLTNVSIPQMLPLMNSIVPCNQIITLNNNPIQPIAITSVGVQQSTTPGVASVSIVPTISQPLMVGNPLPILQPQFINITNSPLTFNTQGNSNIHTVISVVPQTVNPVLTQDVPKDTPVVQTEPTSASRVETPNSEKTTNPEPKDVPKQSQDINKAAASPSKEEHLKKKSDCNDPEDENLLSLLDELVLLSQQLTNEDELETSSEERRVVVPGDVQSSSEKQETEESDDGRSLSPLFLTLDEDLMSPDSKDEIDMTRKVDDLVKDIFGSDSSLDSSDSLLKTQSSQAPTCSIKGDSSTPPPLTYMKAALEATSGQSSSERTSVTWRPMPKLVPLGLKTQDAKGTGSTAFSLDSKEPQI